MTINATKLSKELIAAGISTHGNCDSSGVVWDDSGNQIQTRADVIAVLAAHNPNPSAAELESLARVRSIQIKNMTPNQAVTWFSRQVHGTDTESGIISGINSASSVNDLKPFLIKIIQSEYSRTKAECEIIELLIAIRDGKR